MELPPGIPEKFKGVYKGPQDVIIQAWDEETLAKGFKLNLSEEKLEPLRMALGTRILRTVTIPIGLVKLLQDDARGQNRPLSSHIVYILLNHYYPNG